MTQRKMVYRPNAEESISGTVVRGLAEAKGVDPADLDECLYDHVDPDALDRLFNGDRVLSRSGLVSFTMAGCRVDIEGAQKVVITPQPHSRTVTEEVTS